MEALKHWIEMVKAIGQPVEGAYVQTREILEESLADDPAGDTGERPRGAVYRDFTRQFASHLQSSGKADEAAALYADAIKLLCI